MEKNTKLIIALSSIFLIGGLGLFLYKKGIFSKNSVEPKVEDMNDEEYINYVMVLARKYGRSTGINAPKTGLTQEKSINEKDKAILNDLINSVQNNQIDSRTKEIIRRLEMEKIALD
jgi:hypothetical protein